MKVHYNNEGEKTLCGKVLKGKGTSTPYIEYFKEMFFGWGKSVRCKICEKKINCL